MKPPGSGRVISTESSDLRALVMDILMSQQGLRRKQLCESIHKVLPNIPKRKIYAALSYLVTSKQVRSDKLPGMTSQYYAGDVAEIRRVKVISADKWHIRPASVLSPMGWCLNQLQGAV